MVKNIKGYQVEFKSLINFYRNNQIRKQDHMYNTPSINYAQLNSVTNMCTKNYCNGNGNCTMGFLNTPLCVCNDQYYGIHYISNQSH